mgnify:CR=1 FL=1
MSLKLYIPKFEWGNHLMIEIFARGSDGKAEISKEGASFFTLVDNPENSDWILIPAFISSMTHEGGKQVIHETHKLAQRYSKPFGVFSNSDLIVNPGVESLYIFTPGAYGSFKNQVELPAVLPYDPVLRWMKDGWSPQDRVSVGFCGQATRNPLKTIKDFLTVEKLRLNKFLGLSPFLHIPRFLPAYQRGLLLHSVRKSKLIQTDFILRSHYKGGASSVADSLRVEEDFYQNIASNLFTLCIRGMGNYSVRFYQTLAMGRIPVLIDTDSLLPFSDQLDYRDLIVSVPYAQRFRTDHYILSYLEGKTPEDLREIQRRCRNLWLENFQLSGMLHNLYQQMKKSSLGSQG